MINKVKHINVYANAIERSARSLRAEIASLSEIVRDEDYLGPEISSGLGDLLSANSPLPPQVCEPYSPFFPGVWVGMDTKENSFVSIVTKVGRPLSASEITPLWSRLVLTPTIFPGELPRWITLETQVDPIGLLKAKKAKIAISAHFSFGGDNPPISKTYKIILRLVDENKGSHDVFEYSLPLTTMSLNYSVNIPIAKLEALRSIQCKSAVLSFFLPTQGNYIFSLDFFELNSSME